MTNRIAIILALILIALAVYDGLAQDWGTTQFLLRQLTRAIEYLAFWR